MAPCGVDIRGPLRQAQDLRDDGVCLARSDAHHVEVFLYSGVSGRSGASLSDEVVVPATEGLDAVDVGGLLYSQESCSDGMVECEIECLYFLVSVVT
jgi:hypothetical protein